MTLVPFRRVAVGAVVWLATAGVAHAQEAPDVTPNRSIPGTGQLQQLAGGLMTVGLIAAAIGLVISLGGLAIAGHTHNVHLRERFKHGAGLSLLGTIGFGAANRLMDWAWGIGVGF